MRFSDVIYLFLNTCQKLAHPVAIKKGYPAYGDEKDGALYKLYVLDIELTAPIGELSYICFSISVLTVFEIGTGLIGEAGASPYRYFRSSGKVYFISRRATFFPSVNLFPHATPVRHRVNPVDFYPDFGHFTRNPGEIPRLPGKRPRYGEKRSNSDTFRRFRSWEKKVSDPWNKTLFRNSFSRTFATVVILWVKSSARGASGDQSPNSTPILPIAEKLTARNIRQMGSPLKIRNLQYDSDLDDILVIPMGVEVTYS